MPMLAGSVSVVGGVAVGTGFAKEVYDRLEAGTDFMGAPAAGLQQAKSQLAVIANATAQLILHVQSAATVSTTDVGLGPIAWSGTGTGTVA